jgi:flagellar biogenesis protein FliO
VLESLTTLQIAESKAATSVPGQLMRWLRSWCSRPARQLRLRESLALGERRFVAVIEFGERRFLIGGTGASMVLLARLPAADREDIAGEGKEE